jgi:SAM-dependent methyltransferase
VILDGACGNGSLVSWLHSCGYGNATGVDLAPEQVDVAKSLGIVGVEQGDFRDRLRGSSGTFDLVILRDVLEHFSKEDILAVLDDVALALKPGGSLLLHVPNAESPFFGRIRYGDFTHETAFTPSSLEQVLRACGYARIDIYPSEVAATSFRSRVRLVLWRLLAGIYRSMVFVEVGRRPSVVTQNLLALATTSDRR